MSTVESGGGQPPRLEMPKQRVSAHIAAFQPNTLTFFPDFATV